MRIFFAVFLLMYVSAWSQDQQPRESKAAKRDGLNPVINANFPDPTVIKAAGKYYAYATQGDINGQPVNIQVASSTDLFHWKTEGDALPIKPFWANNSFWAPHVLYDAGLKKYVLFYSGESVDTTIGKCLGVAFSSTPTGPFTDKGEPLICGEGFVNIDPMAIIDPKSGRKLLYWGSGFQPIKVQELTDDWKAFKPSSHAKAVVWPGKEKKYTILIEGAWVNYHGGKYYLFYSGDNCCGDKANYAVMVARSDTPFGPFQRYGEVNGRNSSVILEKDDLWLAPGHNSVVIDAMGRQWIVYHAIPKADKGKKENRVMCMKRLIYKNGWPVVLK